MRTIEEEAEIIYGKRKPNAEDTRIALVKEKKRICSANLTKIEIPSPAPKDEGELCDLILRHAHLLTCYNCGDKLLSDKVQVNDQVGVLHIDPGANNYPIEPDEPAVAYFECIECAQAKSKGLNKIQTDLLSSFLVGHWKKISKSEHRVAFERILETLNPGALQAVKNLQKVM